jgi:hypothetical protein
MKSFTKTMMVAAAAVVMSAGVVSAQSLKADIPFAFRASGKTLAPGSYRVDVASGTSSVRYFRLRNETEGQAVLSMPVAAHDANKDWRADGKARLAFACGGSGCELIELWQGGNDRASYQFRQSKPHGEDTRMAVVEMRPAGKSE